MADLARMLHTQPSTLTRWKTGSQPNRNTLIHLAGLFGVEMEWLARGTGPRRLTDLLQPRTETAEHFSAENRLEDMGYNISKEPEAGALPKVLLSVLPMDVLLAMVESLISQPRAMRAVLDEIRRRTAQPAKITLHQPTQPKP